MSATADRGDERRFSPTSGTLVGWCGIALVTGVIGYILLDDRSLVSIRFAVATAIFGVLVWCYLLRPRLVIRATEVELRNAFSSWHVPLRQVRRVAVRVITRIYTDDGQFDGVAVGRSVRSMRGGRSGGRGFTRMPGLNPSYSIGDVPATRSQRGNLDANGVADFVTEQILVAADNARASSHGDGSAYRTWAMVELVALGVLAVVLVVTLAL